MGYDNDRSNNRSRSFDSLSDYIDVASRIVEFRTKHPDGSLQPLDTTNPYTVETIAGDTYIVVVAAAYRTPDDDKRPGIGMAYEQFPGRTPYTRGSELQNAETAAWGRAIVATLAADTKKGIASAEEVRNRQAERHIPTPTPMQPEQRSEIFALFGELGVKDPTQQEFANPDEYEQAAEEARTNRLAFLAWALRKPKGTVTSPNDLTAGEANTVIEALRARIAERKAAVA